MSLMKRYGLGILATLTLVTASVPAAHAGRRGRRNTAIALGAISLYGFARGKPEVGIIAGAGAYGAYRRYRSTRRHERYGYRYRRYRGYRGYDYGYPDRYRDDYRYRDRRGGYYDDYDRRDDYYYGGRDRYRDYGYRRGRSYRGDNRYYGSRRRCRDRYGYY